MASDVTVVVILLAACLATLLTYTVRVTGDWNRAAGKLERLRAENPYAHLLGRAVEARVYEGSDWEPFVVVAVSWKGAVCVRRPDDPEHPGRWIPKDRAPERVREITEGTDGRRKR